MAEYINDALDRIVLMQQAAITKPDGNAPEAYDHPFVKASSYPYWLNWLGLVSVEVESNTAETRYHDFTMRLVMGHIVEDYQGARPELLNDYVAQVLDYFNARPLLKRTWADTAVPYLAPEMAFITAVTGIFTDDENQMVVCDFTLSASFLINLDRIF